jgi:hypothetical protein
VTSIACGDRHTIAASEGGAVWVWGSGDAGQLGLGRDGPQHLDVPTTVPVFGASGSAAVHVAAGALTSAAIAAGGRAYVWGEHGACGRLGIGPDVAQPGWAAWEPVTPGPLFGLITVAVALGDTFSAFLVLPPPATGGGEGSGGDWDDGASVAGSVAPSMIGGSPGAPVIPAWALAEAVAGGPSHGASLLVAGALGVSPEEFGTRVNALSWPHWTGLFGAAPIVTAISAGAEHLLAVSDGCVYCAGRSWGDSGAGGGVEDNVELGAGPGADPEAVAAAGGLNEEFTPVGELDGDVVVEVAAGVRHSLARTADGRIFAWG